MYICIFGHCTNKAITGGWIDKPKNNTKKSNQFFDGGSRALYFIIFVPWLDNEIKSE